MPQFSLTNYITLGLIFIISLMVFPLPVVADNLYSPNFRIQMGTINIGGGEKAGGGFKLSDTIGQTAQGQFDTAGFRVRAGFQYVRVRIPFTFRVDNLAINFGSLVPNTFSNATNTLTVSAGGAYGYAVKAIENRPMTLSGGANTIPDTACDAGLPCSITDATPWTSSTAYGFGYNMSGNDIDTADFVNNTYFRPFANNNAGQDPVTVMSRAGVTRQSIATVKYQVNVSPIQAAGFYQNSIQYIAIPAY